jgi:HlyD family secretion protein
VVSAEASIVPYKTAYLSSKVSGRVLKKSIEEGQEVKAGQELLVLDSRDQDLAVRRAQASLEQAQAALDKAKNGARPEEIAASQAAVDIAQAGVNDAQVALEVSQGNLVVTQAKVASAQANLEKVKAGPTPEQVNEAAAVLRDATAARDQAQAAYDRVKGDAHLATLPQSLALQQATNEFDRARAAYQNLLNGATAADIKVAQSAVGEAQAGVQVATTQVDQTRAKVDTAKGQLEQAQAQLALIKAGTRSEDIASAQATVSQMQVALDEALAAKEDTVVKAPFDGVIGEILVNEGEQVMPQAQLVRIGDLTKLEVETKDLSEVDINQVRVGQDATIRVDALGGKSFPSKVSNIAPVATDNRGDKVYKVTLALDAGLKEGLRWGMTTFADINVR